MFVRLRSTVHTAADTAYASLMLAAGLIITGAVCTLCCGLRRRAKERRMDPDAAEVRAQRDFALFPASLCAAE